MTENDHSINPQFKISNMRSSVHQNRQLLLLAWANLLIFVALICLHHRIYPAAFVGQLERKSKRQRRPGDCLAWPPAAFVDRYFGYEMESCWFACIIGYINIKQ
jgi:hypothetical protein